MGNSLETETQEESRYQIRSAIGPGGLAEERFTVFEETEVNGISVGSIRKSFESIKLGSHEKLDCTTAAL